MDRSEIVRLGAGAELWVTESGERVLLKWLTTGGARCATSAGDRTYELDELQLVAPAHKGPSAVAAPVRRSTGRRPRAELAQEERWRAEQRSGQALQAVLMPKAKAIAIAKEKWSAVELEGEFCGYDLVAADGTRCAMRVSDPKVVGKALLSALAQYSGQSFTLAVRVA